MLKKADQERGREVVEEDLTKFWLDSLSEEQKEVDSSNYRDNVRPVRARIMDVK